MVWILLVFWCSGYYKLVSVGYCFLAVVLGCICCFSWWVRCLVFWLRYLFALLFVYFADCGLIAHYLVAVLC